MDSDEQNVLKYAPAAKRPMGFWRMLLILAFALSVLSLLLPSLDRRPRTKVGETKCSSNLRQVGMAMFLYAEWNRGAFACFDIVLAQLDVGPEVFVCPQSNEQKAKGSNLEKTVADFRLPGRCSYVYVDAGLRLGVASGAILAFEDPAAHGMEGMNILFADGHVEWVALPRAMAHLNDLANGVNPPTSAPMASEQAAVKAYEKNWRAMMPTLKVKGLRAAPAESLAPDDRPE